VVIACSFGAGCGGLFRVNNGNLLGVVICGLFELVMLLLARYDWLLGYLRRIRIGYCGPIFELTTLVVIGTDCIERCTFNYNTQIQKAIIG
jgi:hypothetical protein